MTHFDRPVASPILRPHVVFVAAMSEKRKRREPASGREGHTALADGALIDFHRRPFTADAVGALTDALRREVPWTQRTVTVFGKKHLEPRLQCYQADDASLVYKYSGLTIVPVAFSPCVLAIRNRLFELFPGSPRYNTCLLNRYRNGDDSMGWHTDQDVARYGQDPHIASVSFGAERTFRLRRIADEGEKVDYVLGGGAVLVMHGTTQRTWQHSVPKQKSALERFNLTFRHIIAKGVV